MKASRIAVLLLCWSVAGIYGAAQAEAGKGFCGTWAMRLGDQNLYVLTVTEDNGKISGVLDRPEKISSLSNAIFANIGGSIIHLPITQMRYSNGALHFALPVRRNLQESDHYTMTVNGDRAELVADDNPNLYPLLFERAATGTLPSPDWEPNRAYSASDSNHSNKALKAMFDEDQADRSTENADWNKVSRHDAEHRERLKELLKTGSLHTGEDYERAAFIFQHGATPDDYLLAHTLAMIAVSKGDATAIWIASATLDRYLVAIKQKQIYGTQFMNLSERELTQDPYARDVISDSLRRELAVPSQPMQAQQLKSMEAQP